ncbi:RDD family protein [Virgibacillus xinjiangensis]|uniref:RDD family protein n=1 Tax=Virgibacillus xinjiangensis TaxID=393090 RepID=A0ABV7CR68_9BACI
MHPKPAGFWIRFLALFVDSLLSGVLTLLIAVLIGDTAYFSAAVGVSSMADSIGGLIYSVVFVILFTASNLMGSPGKLACRIKVVNTDMTQVTLWKSIGRWLAYFLSTITFLIGYMMAGWNEEKKALHDMVCGTRVVYRD